MRYRNLGNTGLIVSEIGFGTIPILSGNIPVLPSYYSPNTELAVSIMQYAFDKGCNLYDTAIIPEYGDAEVKLGVFATNVGRENIIIADKARFFEGGDMYDAVLTSLKNLGTSFIDIYFVHQVDLDNVDTTFGIGGAIDALYQLKLQGKINFVGVATHYYDILLQGARDKRVDVLQGSGNILERGMLDRVEQETIFKQKGFLVNKVYAAGILPAFFATNVLVSGMLSYPISSAVVGMGTYEEVDLALLCHKNEGNYEKVSFNTVISRLEKYFSVIPCTRCQLCNCKFGTGIHFLLRQYNYFFLGIDYWALKKLGMSIE